MSDNPSTVVVKFQNSNGAVSNSIVNWESYEITSDFMTPCDTFSMVVGSDKLTQDVRDLLDNGGTIVNIFVDVGDNTPRPILVGNIDEAVLEGDANQTYYHIHGRNVLGEACETGIDPWTNANQVKEGETASQFFANLFSQIGILNITNSDIADRSIKTGNSKLSTTYQSITKTVQDYTLVEQGNTGQIVSQASSSQQQVTYSHDPSNDFDMEALTLKQLKPEHHETVYEYGERIAKRFHAHIWAQSDGKAIVISKPDYTQIPTFYFNNTPSAPDMCNVEKVSRSLQYKNQPALIIGRGQTDTGDLSSTTIRAAKISEFYGYDQNGNPTDPVKSCLGKYHGLVPVPYNANLQQYQRYFSPPDAIRTFYVYDKHAKTHDQVEGVVMRRMAEHMKNALRITYTVDGHDQNGLVYVVNTICGVNDEVLNIAGTFWIESVKFSKDAINGTHTQITLIPPYVLYF